MNAMMDDVQDDDPLDQEKPVDVIGDDGKIYRYPPGTDPQRAARITRAKTITPETARPLGPPNKETASTEQFHKPNVFQQDAGTSLVEGAKGFGKDLLSTIPGLVKFAADAVTTAGVKPVKDIYAAMQATGEKANDPTLSTPEMFAYDIAGRVPVLGPMAAGAWENMGSGDPERMGAGLSQATQVALGLRPKFAATTAAEVANKVPGSGRLAGAVRQAVKDPVTAAVGAYEGYQHGGTLGGVAGALGAPIGLHRSLRYAGKMIGEGMRGDTPQPSGKTGEPPGPKTAKVQKGMEPRLVDPSIESMLQDELKKRSDALPDGEPPPSDLPPSDVLSPDAMESRIQEANQHAQDVVSAQRPGPRTPPEGARLTDPRLQAELARDLGQQIDMIPSHDTSIPDDMAAEVATARKLYDQRVSGPRGTARIGPNGQPVIEPASTDFTRPTTEPNAGGRLASGESAAPIEQSVQEALLEALKTRELPPEAAPSPPGPGGRQVGESFAHTMDTVRGQRPAPAATPAPPPVAPVPSHQKPSEAATAPQGSTWPPKARLSVKAGQGFKTDAEVAMAAREQNPSTGASSPSDRRAAEALHRAGQHSDMNYQRAVDAANYEAEAARAAAGGGGSTIMDQLRASLMAEDLKRLNKLKKQ